MTKIMKLFRNPTRKPSRKKAIEWPTIMDEIDTYRGCLNGKVLNAGSGVPVGDRDISSLVNGELYNLDIFEHELIHITSPLDVIPVEDQFFDTVFCNAVLEHVRNPVEVLDEINRVLKPGGYLYLAVPFMQPEHLVPTDFQRYTLDGLTNMVENAGFKIVQSGGVHNVYITIGWIVEEWLNSRKSLRNTFLKWILFPPLRFLSRNSKEYVHSIASVYRVLASKK